MYYYFLVNINERIRILFGDWIPSLYQYISGTKKPFLDCFYGNSKVEEKNCLMATKPVLGSQPCVLKSCPKWEHQ